MILAWVVFGLGVAGVVALIADAVFGTLPARYTQAEREAYAFGWGVGFTVAVVAMLVGAGLLDAAYGTAIR